MEENTRSIRIIKRNNEEMVFDTRRIIEAIQAAIDSALNAMDELIEEMTEDAGYSLFTFLHSFWHCFMDSLFFGKRKGKASGHIPHSVIMAAVLAPSVCSTTTLAFGSFIELIRNVFLLRTQDRGCDDFSSVGCYTYISLLNA